MKKLVITASFLLLSVFTANVWAQQTKAQNPVIYADVPDLSMIRVGDTYYMGNHFI